MRRKALTLVQTAAGAIGFPLVVATTLAGSWVGAACGQAAVATQVSRANAGRISVAETMAADISSDAAPFMQIVLNSKWGAGYGVVKPGTPDRRDPGYQRLKAAEREIRDRIARLMRKAPGVRSVDLSYGYFTLFVERRLPTTAEREEWIATSGGDMYSGAFSSLKLGQPMPAASAALPPDVETATDSVFVGVPVVKEGRFVCVLEVEFDKSP